MWGAYPVIIQFKNTISVMYYTYKYYVNMFLHVSKTDIRFSQWIKRMKNHFIFLLVFSYICYIIILTALQILFYLSDDDTGVVNVFIVGLILLYSIAMTSDIGKKNIRLFFLNSPFNKMYIYRALLASELGLPILIFVLTCILLFPVLIGQIILNKFVGFLFCLNILFLFFTEIFFVSSIKILTFSITQKWDKIQISNNITQQFFVLFGSILLTIFFEKIYLLTLNGIKSLFNHHLGEEVIEFFGLNAVSLYSFNYFPISLILLITSFCFFFIAYHAIIKNFHVEGNKRKKRDTKSKVTILLMTKQYGIFTLRFLYGIFILNLLYILRAEYIRQDVGPFILVMGFVSLLSITGSVLPLFFEFLFFSQLLDGKKAIYILGLYNLWISSPLFLIFIIFSNIRITYTDILFFLIGILLTIPFIIIFKKIFLWVSRIQSVSLAKNLSYYFSIVIFIPITLILTLF
jgi:hypothetical protein